MSSTTFINNLLFYFIVCLCYHRYFVISAPTIAIESLTQSPSLYNSSNYHHNYLESDDSYIHLVLSFDTKAIPQAIVAIASIISRSIKPHRLYFHLILINIFWDAKIIHDFQLSVGTLT